MSGIRSLYRGPTVKGYASAGTAPIRVDDSTNTIKIIAIGSGTLEQEVILTAPTQTLTADGAITVAPGVVFLSRAAAATLASIAAPGAAMIGKQMTITAGTDFAHVITFTGATLWDGTTGANTTVTMTAFRGSSITIVGLTATVWNVVSTNQLTSIA